jgi:hypothetical protein
MPTTKHTAHHAGQTFMRSSKSRLYSHVVLVRPCYDHALQIAQTPYPSYESNFRHHRAYLDGTSEFLARKPWENDDATFEARVQKDIDRATAALHGAETVEEYAAGLVARAIAAVEERRAAGEYDKFGPHGWTSRKELAEQQAATCRSKPVWAEVVIVEAQHGSREIAA